MHIERVTLTNFRCFGPGPYTINLDPQLTALVGTNGAGKTALLQALSRLFGTHEQRHVRRQDFHIPFDETQPPMERKLSIDAVFAFPELDDGNGKGTASVPSYFLHMAADANGVLKFRMRLDATWMDDGTESGAIDEKLRSVQTLTDVFDEDADCKDIGTFDRARIQMIYIPASRDAVSQLTMLLRGRLWRAILWNDDIRKALKERGGELNKTFENQIAVQTIATTLEKRWQALYTGGTDATPLLRPIDLRFDRFIRRVEAVFRADEAGRDRGLDELSDGQRSLFHIAMTAAALDVETQLETNHNGFDPDVVLLPALTLLAIEEPENNLAPFYLSRIIRQIQDLTKSTRAQAILSSHSASILSRVEPKQVRHFRLKDGMRTAIVSPIHLPENSEEAGKFVREAVRTYPEMYFARFVVLGEGSSEEVVLPRLAAALGMHIDPSFVAIVPLGGRHVNHLWRLLSNLDIPFATLLDLDDGRKGGGFGRIKIAYIQLASIGRREIKAVDDWGESFDAHVAAISASNDADKREAELQKLIADLRTSGVFFCDPLDLDMSMLVAFPEEYRKLETDMDGPSSRDGAAEAVLKEGDPEIYDLDAWADDFRWYRYLFLTRGKPSTHLRVLSQIDDAKLATSAPEELKALLKFVAKGLRLDAGHGGAS
jgi:putative ATP-dependent endonuclease of the OLD family